MNPSAPANNQEPISNDHGTPKRQLPSPPVALAPGFGTLVIERISTNELAVRFEERSAGSYLVPDPAKENKIDVAGWNAAYGEVFNTAANPVKTARSTVGVAALVNADWLIEIEAFAVYPAGK